MNKVFESISRMPWWVKNSYFVIAFAFFVWMIFFDRNNVLTSYNTNNKLSELIEQKTYYQLEIEKVNKLKEELFSTAENKEKFAREKYLMKKDNEDIFIIVEN
ncbi:MAG: cell division protein DivIC [Planctomycetota bacterium]|jgi:cell division protein DivIC